MVMLLQKYGFIKKIKEYIYIFLYKWWRWAKFFGWRYDDSFNLKQVGSTIARYNITKLAS